MNAFKWTLLAAGILFLAACSSAPFSMPRVQEPSIPSRQVVLTDFGGVGDGVTRNTEAFSQAMKPQLATLSMMGVVTLPLLLTALLLGGCTPLQAVKLVIVITCATLAASSLALLITIFVSNHFLLDKHGRMNDVTSSAGGKGKSDDGRSKSDDSKSNPADSAPTTPLSESSIGL